MPEVVTTGVSLEFLEDPGRFLHVTGAYLAERALVSSVVASFAQQCARDQAGGIALPEEDWWLVVRDASGAVVGAGMRTAPFSPRPLYLLPMPDEAARLLARALHERDEEALGINGALPASELCARELARLTGGTAEVALHMRLHVLGELRPPAPVPGRLVTATESDIDLVEKWFTAFHGDADEQAGRTRGEGQLGGAGREEIRRKVRAGDIWFWVDEAGDKVHLTGANPPAFGYARIGPVFTPPQQRGRGWAKAAVADVSRRIVEDGAQPCLFTDQANATSNRLYADLGYEPVVDTANMIIVPSGRSWR